MARLLPGGATPEQGAGEPWEDAVDEATVRALREELAHELARVSREHEAS